MKNRIRDMREDHDLTQETVANALGITQRKYSYLETGQQQWSEEYLIALAKYYHTSIDYLVGLTDNPKPYR